MVLFAPKASAHLEITIQYHPSIPNAVWRCTSIIQKAGSLGLIPNCIFWDFPSTFRLRIWKLQLYSTINDDGPSSFNRTFKTFTFTLYFCRIMLCWCQQIHRTTSRISQLSLFCATQRKIFHEKCNFPSKK